MAFAFSNAGGANPAAGGSSNSGPDLETIATEVRVKFGDGRVDILFRI